ncbi:hypothetical protein ACFU98_44700 [Streptomyces sp. NPDC057575]|uniref:hypothetical protein n=1 Tax=unclassified Streptomyces TaxID=2593676 RepID=UPI0036C476D2
MSTNLGVFRDGNTVVGSVLMYADSQNHEGTSTYLSVRTTLKLVENADLFDGNGEFKVPAAEPEYKLASSVRRSAKVGAASTRTTPPGRSVPRRPRRKRNCPCPPRASTRPSAWTARRPSARRRGSG